MPIHFSNKIGKLGENILSLSLPPKLTCRPDAPCAKKCYACKGRFTFPNCKKNLEDNWNFYQDSPDAFFERIYYQLSIVNYKYFRYNVSGDIPDENYLKLMCKLARTIPRTNFLCFTKKYEIVNQYIKERHIIPKNLRIVFSRWGDFPCENPYNLPEAYIKFRKEPTEIPENAMECPGYCGDCVFGKKHCWNLNKGESVYFKEH